MDFRSLRLHSVFTLALLSASSAVLAKWQAVPVNAVTLSDWFESDYIQEDSRPGFNDAEDARRFPGCSEGPQPLFDSDGNLLGTELAPSDGSFQFFVDLGADDKLSGNLLIYFSGGGACWDPATCVGSALTAASSYYPATTENADLLNDASTADASGILAVRSDNPYADFDKIYIPYCTGDVHIGSRDTPYEYPLPDFIADSFGIESLEWTIRHRGYDNLLAVLEWLKEQATSDNTPPFGEITIAGSSAGGYAALVNFPVIRQALGTLQVSDTGTDYSIIVDSSNGVLTDGFLDLAFGVPGGDGAWGIWGEEATAPTIDPLLRDVFVTKVSETNGAGSLWVDVFDTVGAEYRDTRISQSTAAYDLVQAIVLLTMKKVDNNTYNPFVAPTEAEVALTAILDWSPKARAAMNATALSVPNYRKYLAEGQGHWLLIDPPPAIFPFPTNNYFLENSARGIYYTHWLDDMLNNPRWFFRTDWKNLSCYPGCLH